MAELKPCPFCGGQNLNVRKGKYMWGVQCCNADCGARGGLKTLKKSAIEAWNRRYTPSEIDFDYDAED